MSLPSFVHHPAFQSLLLPLLLALLGLALLRAWPGGRWALLGGALGLGAALAFVPGLAWPPASRVLKLPWVLLLGLGLACALGLGRRVPGPAPEPAPAPALKPRRVPHGLRAGLARPFARWAMPALVWLAVLMWLWAGQALPSFGPGPGPGPGPAGGAAGWLAPVAPLLAMGVAALAGAGLLALLLRPAGHAAAGPGPAGAPQAVALTMAALGLAGLCAVGGSLLLAQLGLMLATALATTLAIAGWAARGRQAAADPGLALALAPFGLVWLSLACTWCLAAPEEAVARAGLVALLACALLLPEWRVRRHGHQHGPSHGLSPRPSRSLWRTAALAGGPALLALASGLALLPLAGAPSDGSSADTAARPAPVLDDPYLAPAPAVPPTPATPPPSR